MNAVAITLHVAAHGDRVVVTSPDLPGWSARCAGEPGDGALTSAIAAARAGQARGVLHATIPPPADTDADVAWVCQTTRDGAVSMLAAWLELLVGDSHPRLVALVAALAADTTDPARGRTSGEAAAPAPARGGTR